MVDGSIGLACSTVFLIISSVVSPYVAPVYAIFIVHIWTRIKLICKRLVIFYILFQTSDLRKIIWLVW